MRWWCSWSGCMHVEGCCRRRRRRRDSSRIVNPACQGKDRTVEAEPANVSPSWSSAPRTKRTCYPRPCHSPLAPSHSHSRSVGMSLSPLLHPGPADTPQQKWVHLFTNHPSVCITDSINFILELRDDTIKSCNSFCKARFFSTIKSHYSIAILTHKFLNIFLSHLYYFLS